jgi:sugar lactone lactonase YvrE
MDKLWFANGVAVSLDNTYVLVADSIQSRIHRYGFPGLDVQVFVCM